MIHVGPVTHAEPNQSLAVNRIEGGFMLMSPPDAHWAAEDPMECVQLVADWLGVRAPARSASSWVPTEIRCPINSQFAISKTHRRRFDAAAAYVLSYHLTTQDSHKQRVTFSGGDVLELLARWAGSAPEEGAPSISRICLVPELDPKRHDVFIVKVQTAITAYGWRGAAPDAPPWVLVCEDPKISLGITDPHVIAHFEALMVNEVEGRFAVRITGDNTLEIGPRVDLA